MLVHVQEQLRSTDAHAQLVEMLKQHPYSDLAHRILLVFQTIADKEADRKLLVSFDCATALKPFLVSNFSPEVMLFLLNAQLRYNRTFDHAHRQVWILSRFDPATLEHHHSCG